VLGGISLSNMNLGDKVRLECPVAGLRFYRKSVCVESNRGTPVFRHGSIESGRSDFDLIFRCLYPRWIRKVFVDPYCSGDDEYISELKGKFGDKLLWATPATSVRAFRATALDSLGFGIPEFDSCELLVYNIQPNASLTFEELAIPQYADGRNEWRDGLHCVLHNFDGVYWELFSTDQGDYRKLLETHSQNGALTMYWVDFQADYPTPRNFELRPAILQDLHS
jgi:hypothetical protein